MEFVMKLSAKTLALFLALGLILAPSLADAKAGKGFSGGSRGQRSFSAPPPTQSAPAAKPLERSANPEPARPAQQAAPQAQPGQAPMASPMSPGRSFFSGLAGGLIGAGIAGMLFGNGFGGGMGMGGMLGGLLQVALLGGLAYLLFSFFKRRSQTASARPAMAGGPQMPFEMPESAPIGGGGGLGQGAVAQPHGISLALQAQDFDVFEQTLQAVQSAWSRRDLDGLGRVTTEEMHGYFTEILAKLAEDGLENHIDSVKLDKGDLSEAWSEGATDYATVSLRFSALDYTFDKASGKIVEGSDRERIDATEYWTFRRENSGQRENSGDWKLSAIQQV